MATSEAVVPRAALIDRAGSIAWSKVLMWVALTPVFVFLVLPSLIVVPLAFTSSRVIEWPPPSFSLDTFGKFFADSAWTSAMASSFVIALAVMVIAVIVGTMAAIALGGKSFRGRGLLTGMILLPLAIPVVVLALGDFAFLARWHLVGTRPGIALAQSVLAVPFVYVVMSAALSGLNPALVRSAQSLGAGAWSVFRHVYFPAVKMGLIASALFAFIVSFDEPVVAYFLQGPDATTLPVKMFADIQYNLTPLIAVSSTLLLAVSTTFFLVLTLFVGRRSKAVPLPGGAIPTTASSSSLTES
ncbi:MAG: ABC transporter permease [Solirubrobacteraceae bacterium]